MSICSRGSAGSPCTAGKESACQCRRCTRLGFGPWVRKSLWRRKWQPAPVFLPGKFHGQSLRATIQGAAQSWAQLATRECAQRVTHPTGSGSACPRWGSNAASQPFTLLLRVFAFVLVFGLHRGLWDFSSWTRHWTQATAVLTTGLAGTPLFNCILKRGWRPPQPRWKQWVWLFLIKRYLQKQWPGHKP